METLYSFNSVATNQRLQVNSIFWQNSNSVLYPVILCFHAWGFFSSPPTWIFTQCPDNLWRFLDFLEKQQRVFKYLDHAVRKSESEVQKSLCLFYMPFSNLFICLWDMDIIHYYWLVTVELGQGTCSESSVFDSSWM